MMTIPIYQLDAFTGTLFAGNPAAVCPLDVWLDDRRMQAIAAENNLAETAFFVPEGGGFRIRWFTPGREIDLCGHATLASAWVVMNRLTPGRESVTFESKSGPLTVRRAGERLEMDFPSREPSRIEPPAALTAALGRPPLEVWRSRDLMAVFAAERDVRSLSPDLGALASLDCLGVIVTAPGDSVDFVSRFFAPGAGVPEDPVTGSAHCTLAPYWAKRLGRTRLEARQVSSRGGEIECELAGDRVLMRGDAVLYLTGAISV